MDKKQSLNFDRVLAQRDFELSEAGLLDKIREKQLSDILAQQARAKEFNENRRTYGDLGPTVGAIGAGLIAAPFTAGASLPAALAIAGGAGAVGGGLGSLIGQQYDAKEGTDFGNVLEEGAISGAFNAGGLGLGRAFTTARAGGGLSELVGMTGDDLGSFAAGAKASRAAGFADDALSTVDDSGKLSSAAGRSTSKGVKGRINDAGVRRFFNLRESNVRGVTDAGKNPLEIGRNTMSKLGLGVDDYDDALGAIDDLGNGGKIGRSLSSNSDKIRASLQGKTVSVNSFYDDLAEKSAKLRKIPTQGKKADFLDDIIATRPANPNMPATDAYDLKILLDEQFGKSIAAGDELTATSNSVQKAFGNTLRAQLKTNDDVAKLLSENQDLIISRELLKSARNSLGIAGQRGFFQSLTPQGAINALSRNKNISGRAASFGGGRAVAEGGRMATLSGALGSLSPTVAAGAQQTTGQLAGRQLQGLLEQFDPNDPVDAEIIADLQAAGIGQEAPQAPTAGMASAGFAPQQTELQSALSDPAMIQNLMFQDLQQTGGKNISDLKAIFEMGQMGMETQGGLELNNTAITNIADLKAGLDQLSTLESDIQSNSANNPVLGRLRGINPFDDSAGALQSKINLTKQIVGKALEGGVLRKEDEVKYSKILPTLGDTDGRAQEKINLIRADIQNKLDLYLQAQQQYGGGGGQADLASQLAQVQGVY